MLERWFDDLPERLLTHYVGGAWRAPLGADMHPVLGQGGRVLGQVVCATPADLARAQVFGRAIGADARAPFVAALRHAAPVLAQNLGRFIPNAPDLRTLLAQADHYAATGVFALDTLPDPLHGAVLLPDTKDAVLGVALVHVAQIAGLPAGALALLHAPLNRQIKRDP